MAKAIKLPRLIRSDEFSYDNPPEGCYAACLLMLLIYWRVTLFDAAWQVPASPTAPQWKEIGKWLFDEVSIGGVKTKVVKEKKIPSLLKKVGANTFLKYAEFQVPDLVSEADRLAQNRIPSMLFYDASRLYKGIRSGGAVHSCIFLEAMADTIRVTDPTNLGAFGYQTVAREAFRDATSEFPATVAFFYPQSKINIVPYRPEATLEKWVTEGTA